MTTHWQVISHDGQPMATVPTIGEALTLARPGRLNIRRITPGEPPLTMRSAPPTAPTKPPQYEA